MMTYLLTPKDVASITDADVTFGTVKLLPAWELIPSEFKAQKGLYAKLTHALFYGTEVPDYEVVVKEGFDQALFSRCVQAHLRSWEPKQQHKMAGVAYMISCMAVLIEKPEETPSTCD